MVKDILNDRLVHIESQEDIGAVFDKIKKNKSDSLVLVIPKQAIAFRSLVGLQALKEKVDSINKKIYIITPDLVGQSFAERTGFEVIGKEETPEDIFLIGAEEKPKRKKKIDIVDIKAGVKDAEHIKSGHGYHPELEEIFEESDEYYKKLKKEGFDDFQTEKEAIFTRLFQSMKSRDKETEIEIHNDSELAWKARGFFVSIKHAIFSSKLYLGVGIAVVAVLAILAFVVLPKADITMFLRKDTVKFTIQAVVSNKAASVDYTNLIIPGQLVEVEENISKDFNSSKEIEVNDRARGIITIYNEYSSSNQGLVATTRFETLDGKIFRTAKSVIAPGAVIEEGKMRAGTIDVEVFADEPGDTYNIMPTKFTIPGFKGSPKFAAFYGVSKEQMKGGKIGKAKVVSADDLDVASKELKDEIKAKLMESLNQKVPTGFTSIENSEMFSLAESIFDAVSGDRADVFKGQASGKISVMLYKEEDYNQLIDKIIEEKISADQAVYENEKSLSYKISNFDVKNGKLFIDVDVIVGVVKRFDLNDLRESLSRRNPEELKQYFSLYPEIEKAEVDLWPFWVKKVPRNANKIKIYIKASE